MLQLVLLHTKNTIISIARYIVFLPNFIYNIIKFIIKIFHTFTQSTIFVNKSQELSLSLSKHQMISQIVAATISRHLNFVLSSGFVAIKGPLCCLDGWERIVCSSVLGFVKLSPCRHTSFCCKWIVLVLVLFFDVKAVRLSMYKLNLISFAKLYVLIKLQYKGFLLLSFSFFQKKSKLKKI